MERIGLFGGSFNPIHFGHLIPAQAAAEALGLQTLYFVPSAIPPHKQDVSSGLADAGHRLEMVRRAVSGHPVFDVTDIELHRNGPSYTIDTIAEFRDEHGLDVMLHWLIGGDSLGEIGAWRRAADLVDACRIVTMVRPGWDVESALSKLVGRLGEDRVQRLRSGVIQTPLIDVSATQIRHRVAARKSIRYLLPSVVRRYIEDQGLYRRAQ